MEDGVSKDDLETAAWILRLYASEACGEDAEKAEKIAKKLDELWQYRFSGWC